MGRAFVKLMQAEVTDGNQQSGFGSRGCLAEEYC